MGDEGTKSSFFFKRQLANDDILFLNIAAFSAIQIYMCPDADSFASQNFQQSFNTVSQIHRACLEQIGNNAFSHSRVNVSFELKLAKC